MGNKEKRNRRDDIIIYTTGTILLLGTACFIGSGIARTFVGESFSDGLVESPKMYSNKESIIRASKEAVNSKKYMVAFVEQEEPPKTDSDGKEEGVSATYTYRYDKTTDVVSYTYINNTSAESSDMLLEYWTPTDDGKWDTYIWASEVRSYVNFTLDTEPITMLNWDLLDNMDDYILLDDYGEWGDRPESCYVFALYGKSDVYDTIAEYVYISRSTLLPMGIITVGSDSIDDVASFATDASTSRITDIKNDNMQHLDDNQDGDIGVNVIGGNLLGNSGSDAIEDSAEETDSTEDDSIIEESTESVTTEEYSTDNETLTDETTETSTEYIEETTEVTTDDYVIDSVEYEANQISIIRISYNWTNLKPNGVTLPTKVMSEEEYLRAVGNEE